MGYKMLKSSQNHGNEDPRRKNINNNPCGICRAIGLPVCKGHGGGSGGDSDTSDNKQQTELQVQSGSMPFNSPMLKPKNSSLLDLLEQSPWWTQTDEIFRYKNSHALLSLTLTLENNTLRCHGHDDLTQEEQHALDTLFKTLEQELNRFKKESPSTNPMQAHMSRIGNQMTINIPNPKYFDAFIQRLADKNLLALTDKNLLLAQPDPELKATMAIGDIESSEQYAPSWAAPNPFALTPKPKE